MLREGRLVGIPTETVYGLAGNAFDDKAIAGIFQVKNRPFFDPLIVHINTFEGLSQLVRSIPREAILLAEAFMPGPLTLLLPKKDVIPEILTAGSFLVAIRIPSHPMTQELLSRLSFPLAAPSANPFGYISPTTAKHVEQQLGDKIPYILDGGACKVGVESTIVGFEKGKPTVFRKGGIAIEAIEEVIGPVRVRPHSSSRPDAPGMLKSHYSPKIPIKLGNIESLLKKHHGNAIGVISFKSSFPSIPEERQVLLSRKGDFAEAAHNLFSGMRYLDGLKLDVILAELLPERDLGKAINDRLRRASAG